MVKIGYPVLNFSFSRDVTQLFGFNSTYYAKYNIPGHNGLDIRAEYGAPIIAAHDGYIHSMTVDDPNHTRGNGIYLRSNDSSYYTIYWHLEKFNGLYPGMKVDKGQIIGFCGNTGDVFPKPTPSNPHAGTHLHFGFKTASPTAYAGCLDPTPRIFQIGDKIPQKLVSDLTYGSRGDQVALLQTMMVLDGIRENYDPHGRFGLMTGSDVKTLQKKYGLLPPATPWVGKQTRGVLNNRYSAF